MKLLVKRENKHFQKARIEIEDVKEWTLLSIGLDNLLKENEESIKFWQEQIENPRDWSDTESDKRSLTKAIEDNKRIKQLIHTLDHKNETQWDGK